MSPFLSIECLLGWKLKGCFLYISDYNITSLALRLHHNIRIVMVSYTCACDRAVCDVKSDSCRSA